MIPWRVFWVAAGAVATAAVAGLLLLASVGVVVATTVTLGVLVVWVVRGMLLGTTVMADVPLTTRAGYARLVGAATAAHGVWVTVFRYTWDTYPVYLAAALSGVGVLEYGVVSWVLYQHKHRPPAPPVLGAVARPRSSTEEAMSAALALSGYGHLAITESVPISAGDGPAYGMRFQLQVPPGKTAPLGAGAAEMIGTALSPIIGVPLETRWVQLRKTPLAGGWTLTVVLRNVMGDVIPYQDSTERVSITQPALVGYGLDRAPHYLRLDQHGQDIGQTLSGKTSLIHTKLAYLTRCTDTVIWVCGVEKLWDFVAGWVDPYMGTDYPPPLDWIANGHQDTLNMLIAGMTVARRRQKQLMHTRVGLPHIVIILDEASFALESRLTGTYQGSPVTASKMAAMISKGAGSANVWLLRATQRSTNDHAGDHGADTNTNVAYSGAFRSHDWAEVGRMLGYKAWSLEMPTNPGEYWLDTGGGGPVLLKAPYIQSVDPSKPRLHDGPTVSDVSWSRRGMRVALDAGSAAAAGDAYRLRRTRMDAGMLAYLTGDPETNPTTTEAETDPYRRGFNAVMASLAARPTEVGVPVATMVGRRTRADRIVDILTGAPEPFSPTQILTQLRDEGDTTAEIQVVTNALTKLVTEGRVVRVTRGRYWWRELTEDETNTPGGVGGAGDAAGQDTP